MELKERIFNCVNVTGISSQEQGIANYLLNELWALGMDAEVDEVGNVHGRMLCEKENAKTILLEAHMDQIGLMVSGIDDNGYIKFTALGGVDERILCGAEVEIQAKTPVYGVIGACRHTANDNKPIKNPKIDELRIDIGFGRKEAEARVKIGDAIALKDTPQMLLGDKISSIALDNRAGVAAILDSLNRAKSKSLPYHIDVLFSVGEELGLQGTYKCADAIRADAAIAVDVTFGKTPDTKDSIGVFPLGCGAVICRGPNLHYEYTKQLLNLAKEQGIPYEIEVAAASTGTTAWALQTSGCGVPTMLISIPLRYMHTNVETLALCDVQAVSDLLFAAVTGGVLLAE